MTFRFAKTAAAVLAASFAAAPVLAQENVPQQPKIAPLAWTVLSSVVQAAFPSFTNWLTNPNSAGSPFLAGPGLSTAAVQPNSSAPAQEPANTSAFITALASMAGNALGNAIASSTGMANPVPNPVILGQPDIPLRTTDGQVNYQGLHLAVVSPDATGQNMNFRPVANGFRTGERFKLRMVSTFDAVVVVDNVTPSGMRNRLYPAPTAGEQVVFLKAGQSVLLPLGAGEYFEFANQKGVEQLLVTVRDPRAASNLSNQPIYRQDAAWGSNLMQLTPQGSYPGFTQTLSLTHL